MTHSLAAALGAAITALLFGTAAWTGTLIADVLCEGRAAYEDGPARVAIGRMPFAAAGACVGVGLALHGESPAHLALLLAITLALAGCAAADFACGALPDVLTLVPLALVVALGAASRDWSPALGAACVALPFAAAAFASRGRGMGWGDVKLAALGGALLGLAGAAFAYLLAAVAAYVIARRTAGVRRPIAFGPYLAASIAATLTLLRTI
jgi:leader peptidase (prepilin peptidase)/N-methyltransferase